MVAVLCLIVGWAMSAWPFVVLGLLFLPFVSVTLLLRGIEMATTEYVVTTQRVLRKRGLFLLQMKEIRLEKIEGVTVYENIVQRISQCGTVVISGTGVSKLKLSHMLKPLELRRCIEALIKK